MAWHGMAWHGMAWHGMAADAVYLEDQAVLRMLCIHGAQPQPRQAVGVLGIRRKHVDLHSMHAALETITTQAVHADMHPEVHERVFID
jgi:hypothetical protein